jgi:hypothetical protein
MDYVMQILAAGMLVVVIGVAYLKWIRPLRVTLDFQQRCALLLTSLALAGGLLGSPFWWLDESRSFSWDLPPLASRMLASAGLSFFVVCLLTLKRPTFRRLRLVMLLLFVYLAPLAAAIFLFHLDRFDPAHPITYNFFAIAILMTVASAWFLLQPPKPILPDELREFVPASLLLKSWLAAVGLLSGVWGVAIFVTDQGPSDLIWVWPGDLLTSRLIGVMLLTIALGAIYSLRYADTASVMLAMIITYALGLAAASLWLLTAGLPIKDAYFLVFWIIFLISAAILIIERANQLLSLNRA